jgi:hypothetical protein
MNINKQEMQAIIFTALVQKHELNGAQAREITNSLVAHCELWANVWRDMTTLKTYIAATGFEYPPYAIEKFLKLEEVK